MSTTPSNTDALAEFKARVQRTIDELQSDMDTLRVTTKYLVFDLEATRREKDQAVEACERLMLQYNQLYRTSRMWQERAMRAGWKPNAQG